MVSSVRKIAKHALNIFGIYYKIFNVSLTILLILGVIVIGLRLSFFYHRYTYDSIRTKDIKNYYFYNMTAKSNEKAFLLLNVF